MALYKCMGLLLCQQERGRDEMKNQGGKDKSFI